MSPMICRLKNLHLSISFSSSLYHYISFFLFSFFADSHSFPLSLPLHSTPWRLDRIGSKEAAFFDPHNTSNYQKRISLMTEALDDAVQYLEK